MSQRPIGDYALLSDCHGAALVTRDGSIEWLCIPRFDSPALLSRLLDDEAGHFSIRPAEPFRAMRKYADGSLVLVTLFRTEGGAELVLTDALAMGPNEQGHQLGEHSPHVILRELHCRRGEADVEVEYAPRPEYGLIAPLLHPIDGGILARGGASVLLLSSPIGFDVRDQKARARVRLREGEKLRLALEYRSSAEPAPTAWTSDAIATRLTDTLRAWRSWSELHQSYDGPWKELVLHSGRVLQGLTYFPTGAIVAAATTSLPEQIGGVRNWDYRYTWVRDASLTLGALWVAACPDEADRFFEFLTHAALSQIQNGGHMQIMFGVGGELDLSERELRHLSGWRDSAPVRIGNAAWNQRQLDVYGELLGAAARLEPQLRELDPISRGFLCRVADLAARRWKEKDHGIWESRSEPRHYVNSKVMCWVALERAVRLADLLGAGDRVADWKETQEEIRETILEQAWSERLGAYAQAFDYDVLDASNLVMPIVGFLAADHPRMLATMDAIEGRLTDDQGLVYRYRDADDGIAGDEGTFLLCTFWLAHARALAGQLEQAKDIFERAAHFANDLDLLAEEVDPQTGELLGNFPQAFSHIGLINAAWTIGEAERQATFPRAA